MGIFKSHVKISGVYTVIKKIYRRVSGLYTPVAVVSVRDAGVYKIVFYEKSYPINALGMFDGSQPFTDPSWIAVNYNGRMPKLRTSITGNGSIGGSATHSHGNSWAATTSSYSHPVRINRRTVGAKGSYVNVSSHNHTLLAHSHPNSASNIPTCIKVQIFKNINQVLEGLIIMIADGTSYDANQWGPWGKTGYIYFDNTDPGGSITGSSHDHGWMRAYTSYKTVPTVGDSYRRSHYFHRIHRHSVDHAEAVKTLQPYAIRYKMIKALTNHAIVPVGGVILANEDMTTVPDGWVLQTGHVSGDFLYSDTTSGSRLGSDALNHSHGSRTLSTGPVKNVTNSEGQDNVHERYTLGGHTHTVTHSHPAADATPPYITLALIRKIS